MKSTIKVSISSIAFNIDEDAYHILKRYLDELSSHFDQREGGKETVEDIESRLAELLLSRMSKPEQAVTMTDVTEVIAIMGKPEELGDGEQQAMGTAVAPSSILTASKKRLYRDPDHKVIAGVCGGLGAYFNLDPIVFRLLFAVFTCVSPFLGSPGLFMLTIGLYILLWICLPKALTMAQKLEMRGESPTVANIERKMREEALCQTGSSKTTSDNSFLRRLLKVVFITLGIIIAIPTICIGVGLLVALIAAIFMGGWILQDGDLSMLNMVSLPNISLTLAKILAFITLIIPLLVMVYCGLRLLFRFKTKAKGIIAGSVIVWLASVLILAGMAGYTMSNYRSYAKVVTEETRTVPSNTIYVQLPANFDKLHSQPTLNFPDRHKDNAFPLLWRNEQADSIFVFPRIQTCSVSDSVGFRITLVRESNAKNRIEARNEAEAIAIPYTMTDSVITLSPATFNLNRKWSGERSRLLIYVPESKKLILDKTLEDGRISFNSCDWDD